MVAREYYSGQLQRLWLDGIAKPVCPFPLGENNLYVAYYASAEMGCHLALDWTLPDYPLDLFCEFRCQTNGLAFLQVMGYWVLSAYMAWNISHW